MNLSKVENPASEFASKYLQERKRYVLIRVIRKFLSETAQFSLCTKKGLLGGGRCHTPFQVTVPHSRKTLSTPRNKDAALERGSVHQSLGHGTVALRRQTPAQMKSQSCTLCSSVVAALGEEEPFPGRATCPSYKS